MVLGLFEGVPYEAGCVALRPGDTLLAYSDGVTETWSPDGDEFGEDRLSAFAVGHRELEAQAQQDEILREIERFEEGARATDDRTLVVLKRQPGTPA